MLVQFSVKNYKSFKDKITMSFIASNYDKTTCEETNIHLIEKFNLRLLKNAVVYGSNSSGKSKIIEAIADTYSVYKKLNKSKDSFNDKG